jgi:hypothetical protein
MLLKSTKFGKPLSVYFQKCESFSQEFIALFHCITFVEFKIDVWGKYRSAYLKELVKLRERGGLSRLRDNASEPFSI